MGERPNVRYSALSKEDFDRPGKVKPEEDLRFKYEPRDTVPWRSITLAVFLLSFGTLFLLISHLIFSGHIGGDSSQAYGFLTLGVLIFVPGNNQDSTGRILFFEELAELMGHLFRFRVL